MLCFFFFFKQKTAYEMRISDWSSDVCSSDLERAGHDVAVADILVDGDPGTGSLRADQFQGGRQGTVAEQPLPLSEHDREDGQVDLVDEAALEQRLQELGRALRQEIRSRSEEHTSELQSLMRISYAVFCLKKKK